MQERRFGTASLAIGCLLAVACGSPSAPDAGPPSPRWETAPEPLATVAPPAQFLGLVAALDNSAAVIGFGVDGTMWSAEAAAGGAFSSPHRIDTGTPRFARGPALKLAPGRVAVAAWEQPEVDHFQGPMLVWANRLAPNAGWGAPALVERRVTAPEQIDPVTANLAPDVAVAPTGEAAVVWAARDVFASVSPDGSTWADPERLDVRSGDQSPYTKQLRVAAGPPRRFVAAWSNGPDGRVAWRESATGWGPTTSFRVDPDSFMDSPRLAADPSGHAVVGWHALVLDPRRFIRSLGVFASVWSETAGWGSLSPLSDPGVETFLIEVLLDPTGGAAAFWLKRDDDRLWVSRLSPTGTWLPSEQVPGAKALPSGMAFLANGDLLVVWADGPSVLASRRRGASWSPPDTLQDGRSDPQGVIGLVALAVNDRGDALAAWTRYLERLRPTLWTSRLRTP